MMVKLDKLLIQKSPVCFYSLKIGVQLLALVCLLLSPEENGGLAHSVIPKFSDTQIPEYVLREKRLLAKKTSKIGETEMNIIEVPSPEFKSPFSFKETGVHLSAESKKLNRDASKSEAVDPKFNKNCCNTNIIRRKRTPVPQWSTNLNTRVRQNQSPQHKHFSRVVPQTQFST